jgi:hypothetical protein
MHVDVLSVLSLFTAAPFVAIAAILSFYLLRRVRWLRNPRTGKPLFGVQPSAVGLGMAFLFLQMFWRPSLSHAIEAREKVDVEEDDEGDPETPEKLLNRQLKRIRRGEAVDRLVMRM